MSEEKEALLKERSEYSLRGWAMRLLRERDEARAEVAEAKRELEELDFLRYEGGEESIGREIEKAEARGYERGVKEAAEVLAKDGWSFAHGKVLALLEKPTS
jgi:hypothetical protein